MKTKTQDIKCPNCASSINVDELLIRQFEDSIKKEMEMELIKRERELDQRKNEVNRLSELLTKEKEDADALVNTKVRAQLHAREQVLKESIRKELTDEKAQQLLELENELTKKSEKLKEFNGIKAQVERMKREMEEVETQITLEKEKELTVRLEQARSTITEQVHQENFLKIKEREKVIDDLKIKLDEAVRQAQQGSMQLQGEVLELEIKDILQEFHPQDIITPTKKGANGADILQVVKNQSGIECGKIYYESKNTKAWSNDWIKKFKEDNLNVKADIMILVSAVLPEDIQRYGIVDGVWVCSFSGVKELSLALRFGLLKLNSIAITHQGKESKMEQLYQYLTSEDFKNVFSSIMEGFKSLQDSHSSEKLKLMKLWKEREKVLERILFSSINFYGSVKGIAGQAVPEIKMLEESTSE